MQMLGGAGGSNRGITCVNGVGKWGISLRAITCEWVGGWRSNSKDAWLYPMFVDRGGGDLYKT